MTPSVQPPTGSTTASAIENLLACPGTHARVRVKGNIISSLQSDFSGEIRDDVAVMMPVTQPSFFDDKYQVMQSGHESEGEKTFCYAQQTALLESYLQPGQVVLDVGCGPSLPYEKAAGTFVIGLEPSFHSIRVNHDVDLRVYGSATAIPMADASVDIIVCFYSIHHMVGATKDATRANVTSAFREFGRVLKPGGQLFVFEMTPITFFSSVQGLLWNLVRRLMPTKLDMYFWTAESIVDLGRQTLPPGTQVEKIFFGTSAFTSFPPAFSLPWLRVPRFLYPLDAKLYKWRKRANG
jgi:ubiquinone/menaquinone biosynthesis C-methylase UbiE